MGIGIGIVLLVAGLVLALDVVTVDLSFVDDQALGWILIIAGVLSLVMALVISRNAGRSRTEVVERREQV